MKSCLELLKAEVEKSITTCFGAVLDPSDLSAEVTAATQPQFGHYQCNSALKIAKLLKCSPREVAQKIQAAIDPTLGTACRVAACRVIEKMEIAGPGFLNIWIDPTYLNYSLQEMLKDPFLGVDRPESQEKIIVEFSSPNIAKELHVGHLRSSIIGDCLARLFEFLGYEVLRLNHVGDWGTQFGMLIGYLDELHPETFAENSLVTLPELMHWYKESKILFDADPAFKKRAQEKVVQLQGGDSKTLEAWAKICAISRVGYQEIYDLLDIKLQERGESFYNLRLKSIVEDLEQKGLVTISGGAKCIFLEDFISREGTPLPMIIQKSDGGYNYDTTDMAAMHQRIFEEKADRIICVTDAGQSLHFQMLQKVAEKAGYFANHKVQFDHVPFGVVLGADGKKFKTRSGATEKLIDLLLEAVSQAKTILQERLPEATPDELMTTARCLGIDAIKYADLSSHRLKDYTFSYDRMLRFEGNTAAFLLYAYVRSQSIKRKIKKDFSSLINTASLELVHPTEIALGMHLRQFSEALSHVAKDLLPNRLADYLYILAEHFHAFFRDCRVEGDPKEDSRLILCEAVSQVLRQGLQILGLKTLEKM